jgi:hypothetical protein
VKSSYRVFWSEQFPLWPVVRFQEESILRLHSADLTRTTVTTTWEVDLNERLKDLIVPVLWEIMPTRDDNLSELEEATERDLVEEWARVPV